MISRRETLRLAALGTAAIIGSHPIASSAASRVRIGVLKFGTVSWELDTLKQHKFDAANGIDLDVIYFAGEDATNVAMLAGAIDMIVTDWLWVSRQRSDGGDVTLAPYSTAVGAIMVKDASPIRTIADLKGKKIGVAGGAIDKSWLLIQALARRDHGLDLPAVSDVVFGAPPLISQKAIQGELDAVLNFWHFCARLEADGFRRLIGAGTISAHQICPNAPWIVRQEDLASPVVRQAAERRRRSQRPKPENPLQKALEL